MPHLIHYHLPRLTIDFSKEIKLLYACRALLDLSVKLTMFFSPMFLFQIGQELPRSLFVGWLEQVWAGATGLILTDFQQGIILVAVFFGTSRIVTALSAIPLGQLAARFNAKTSLFLGYAFQALELSLFFRLEESLWWFPVLVVLCGMKINLIWNPYHTLFATFSKRKHVGEDLGLVYFLLQLMAAISPAIGGMILAVAGFGTLFLAGVSINVVALVLVAMMDDHKLGPRPTWADFWKWRKKVKFNQFVGSYLSRYMNDGTIVLWPIFVLHIVGSIQRVGYLYSASLFLAMITSFFAGIYIDHQKSKRPYYLSGSFLALLWFARSFVTNIWSVVLVDLFDRLTASFHWLVFDAVGVYLGQHKHSHQFYVYRQLIYAVVAIIFWMLVVAVFLLPIGWVGLFGLTSMATLLSLNMNEGLSSKTKTKK